MRLDHLYFHSASPRAMTRGLVNLTRPASMAVSPAVVRTAPGVGQVESALATDLVSRYQRSDARLLRPTHSRGWEVLRRNPAAFPMTQSLALRNFFLVAMPERSHPFPSRTRKLSSPGPMVLQGQLCGRVGRCRGFEGLNRKIQAFIFFRRRRANRSKRCS